MSFSMWRCGFLMLLAAPMYAAAQEHPVEPYVDATQLDCPASKHSFYKQPWRAFLETRSGYEFLNGIGINYNVPKNDELALRLLAETGFKTFRVEIGWGNVSWDETRLNSGVRDLKLLQLCKQHGIRPLILLNAHHGQPCPTKGWMRKITAAARKGDRQLRLSDTREFVLGYSGLSGHAAAGNMFTEIDSASGVCKLAKPLEADLAAGDSIRVSTLKYRPLYPVGTPEYEETAAGWLKYVNLITDLVAKAGIEDYDLEIWNELSFGSNFVHISNYYDTPPVKERKNFLLSGGTCWELTRRTVEQVHRAHPRVRCVWGWSNTTFFHCPIKDLPSGIEGQSYHPYGTGTRSLPKDEDHKGPGQNLEGYTPTFDVRMPEGWAHELWKVETLMRLLNPEARQSHPAGVEHFHHYMTEHGVLAEECGVKDADGAWRLKTYCALRAFCLWLNKGVDVMEYYCAYDKDAMSFGLLPPGVMALPADAKFNDVATPPMRAVRNLTRAFAGAVPIAHPTQLNVSAVELGPERIIFEGDGVHPRLCQRQALAVLPWQLKPGKFVVAVYAMTFDVTKPWADQLYRIGISNLPAGIGSQVVFYDPVANQNLEFSRREGIEGLSVQVPVADYPRLLVIGQ